MLNFNISKVVYWCLVDWLIGWLIHLFIHSFIHSFIHCLIDVEIKQDWQQSDRCHYKWRFLLKQVTHVLPALCTGTFITSHSTYKKRLISLGITSFYNQSYPFPSLLFSARTLLGNLMLWSPDLTVLGIPGRVGATFVLVNSNRRLGKIWVVCANTMVLLWCSLWTWKQNSFKFLAFLGLSNCGVTSFASNNFPDRSTIMKDRKQWF